MVLGDSGGGLWGTPFKKSANDISGIYGIPIMLVNCCELLCVIYSPFSAKFYIFAQCYNDDGIPFIGLIVIYSPGFNSANGYFSFLICVGDTT